MPTYLDVRTETLPPTLRALPAVLWRAEPRGEDKPAKIPYQVANPEAKASSTDPGTWGTVDDALEAYQLLDPAHPTRGPIAGVGLVLTADAGITCLDLDRVLDGDTLDPRAARLVRACASWTERSPSGTGLHVFVRGWLPKAIKGDQIEGYTEKRYIAITGHRWPGTPGALVDRQALLDRLAAVEAPPPRPPWTGPTSPPPDDLAGTLRAKLAGWGVAVGPIRRWEDGFLAELDRCPWATEHTSGLGGAAVMIRASGAYNFACQHAHCGGRDWRAFRAAMETRR